MSLCMEWIMAVGIAYCDLGTRTNPGRPLIGGNIEANGGHHWGDEWN